MSGTKLGGLKARETNLKLHGPDFYKNIGAIGGRNGHTGGFAANHTLAKLAGAKGGRSGKRGMAPKTIERIEEVKELRGKGLLIKEIAKIVGLSSTTVGKYLRKAKNGS